MSSSTTRGGEPRGGGGGGGGGHVHGALRVHEQERHLDARQTEESRTRRGRAYNHEHDHEQLRVHDRDREQHRRPYLFRRHRSGPLEWASVVLFTVLAVVVLVGAVSILVVMLILQPRAPYVAVRTASLDTLQYDQLGALDDVQLSLRVEARNDNAHSAAAFSRLECRLAFAGATLAVLRADAFRVPARGALPLAYVARSQGAPLGDAGGAAMEAALRDGVVPFQVDGEARTRWKIAGLVVINQWTRLACQIRFFWPNGTALPFRCSSKSKFLFF